MFDLYTAASADGHKVSILLEELGLPYAVHALSLDDPEITWESTTKAAELKKAAK